jgi:hypothetical protein
MKAKVAFLRVLLLSILIPLAAAADSSLQPSADALMQKWAGTIDGSTLDMNNRRPSRFFSSPGGMCV